MRAVLRTGLRLGWIGVLSAACSAGGGMSGGQGGGSSTGGSGGAHGGNGNVPSVGGASTGGFFSLGGAGATNTGGTPPIEPPPVDIPRFDRDDCASVAASDLQTLEAGGAVPTTMRYLYPLGDTVFPRGILSAILQWEGPATDTAMLRIRSLHVDYRGCFPVTSPLRLEVPQDVWDSVAEANEGSNDPVSVELTTKSGTAAAGPLAQTWHFASAKLKGAIFYNTYSSPMALAQGAVGGVVMRLLAGAPQPEVFLRAPTADQCIGCHAVSADGTRLVAEIHAGFGVAYGTSASFAVGPTTPPNPPPLATGIPMAAFSGFYPDGTRFLTTARPGAGGPWAPGNIVGTYGPGDAVLHETDTGTPISTSGIRAGAKMPMFSPDGTQIVFTDHAIGGNGKGLATMQFDRATDTFSGYQEIFSDATLYPGWPFFLPDGSGVLFALGGSADYTGAFSLGLKSELYWVDLRDPAHPATPLARAIGYSDTSLATPYLPRGALDVGTNHFPTVSPVAAGGYFWVFFTTRRAYGNTKVLDPALPDSKQIWVAALDIGGTGDISHPAFYLRGQELESGNVRAFAALEPCRENGQSCETGVDCCSRHCIAGTCGDPPVDECSAVDEGCASDADCCPPATGSVECIAGFCQRPEPPIR